MRYAPQHAYANGISASSTYDTPGLFKCLRCQHSLPRSVMLLPTSRYSITTPWRIREITGQCCRTPYANGRRRQAAENVIRAMWSVASPRPSSYGVSYGESNVTTFASTITFAVLAPRATIERRRAVLPGKGLQRWRGQAATMYLGWLREWRRYVASSAAQAHDISAMQQLRSNIKRTTSDESVCPIDIFSFFLKKKEGEEVQARYGYAMPCQRRWLSRHRRLPSAHHCHRPAFLPCRYV